MIPICGLQKTTLLDYPGHLASTIFLGHCNFRCPFCQNSSLLIPTADDIQSSEEEVFSHLKKRQGILEGVCITGGEPTLSAELPDFIKQIKALGYKIKLDTNGTNPTMLEQLLNEGLLDMVAMDIKNSPKHYSLSIGIPNYSLENIEASISILKKSSIPYEFRTTLVKEHHTEEDILAIGNWLKGPFPYFLQNYKDSDLVLVQGLHGFNSEELKHFQNLLIPFLPNTSIRGE